MNSIHEGFMNCYAHAFRFLDRDPYFVVGTSVPDWLTLVDRKVRVRQKIAETFVDEENFQFAQLARGIVRHHLDDDWFHSCHAFVELNLRLSIELREVLGEDIGFRPHLAAHILIEMLLDRALIQRDPSELERYYELVAAVEPESIQQGINQIAMKPTQNISWFIPRFLQEKYLLDYLTDRGIEYRLNRVLQRVKLSPLPPEFVDWLPTAWQRVSDQQQTLLAGFGDAA